MSYLFLKYIHMSLAALSATLFLLRGTWMLAGSPALKRPLVRSLPHMVDSLLLASALGLAFWSGQTPLNSPWLSAKLIALIGYVLLGAVALRYGKTLFQRVLALCAAVACLGYIVGCAITKNPHFFN